MRAGGLAILVKLDDRLARIGADVFLALVEHFLLAMLHEMRVEQAGAGEIVDAELIKKPAVELEETVAGHDCAVVAEAAVFGDGKLHARLDDVAEDGLFFQILFIIAQIFFAQPGLDDSSGVMQAPFARSCIELWATEKIQFLHVSSWADDFNDNLYERDDGEAGDKQSDHPTGDLWGDVGVNQ